MHRNLKKPLQSSILHLITKSFKTFEYMQTHRVYSLQIPHLTTYRLWYPTQQFVYDNIKLCNVQERRVHLTEASPIFFVQHVHYILGTLCVYHVVIGALQV